VNTLFLTAGVAMFLHLALCVVLRRALIGHPSLVDELFAVPNRLLGTPDVIRLLRVRYFLPFLAPPEGMRLLEPWVRATLLATRVTGLCCLCAGLGFFAAAFVEAGR
jgi:hypothetical protein